MTIVFRFAKIITVRKLDTKIIEEAVRSLAAKACVTLTEPCMTALKRAKTAETSPTAAFALGIVLENAAIAKKTALPVCQDTGIAVVFLEIGREVFLTGEPLAEAVDKGVARAYKENAFRASVCDPLTRKNTGDNTPAVVHTQIVEGDKVSIVFMPKGCGSENATKLFMLTPKDGADGIVDAVVETVCCAGAKACPPVYVGVGIGGTADQCVLLAKKALTRPIGERSKRDDVAELEKEILSRINALGIGAQGFGGDTTALGVSAEVYPTHIAALPVAVNIQCHAVRCEETVL